MGQNNQKQTDDEKKQEMLNSNRNDILNNMVKRVQHDFEQKLLQQEQQEQLKQNLKKQNNKTSTYSIKQKDSNRNNQSQNNSQYEMMGTDQTNNSESGNLINKMQNLQKIDMKQLNNNQNIDQNNSNNSNIQQLNPQMNSKQQLQKNMQNSNVSRTQAKTMPNINCDFQVRLFSLPYNVVNHIMKFIINDFKNLSLVSATFYYKLNECLEQELIEIDNKFLQQYIDILSFRNSYLSYTPISINKSQGFRLDQNLIAEVLPSVENKCITLGYTYKTYTQKIPKGRLISNNKNKPVQNKYQCMFKFDVVSKKQRHFWVYKEECRHNFDDKKLSFVQPIIPIFQNDCIKLSINFYNLNGLIDLSSIEWKPFKIENIQEIPIHLDPNLIQTYDKNRICEIEEVYTDWILFEYYHKQEKVKFDLFQPQLKLQEVRCAGVDIVTSKHIFKAQKEGIVKDALQYFGVHVKVVKQDRGVVSEVKKIGLFHDLDNTVELRIGDILIVYISKGD